jgi:hypothetical protein
MNKYYTLYIKIIRNRLSHPLIDIYTENHHIIPKCLGGTDNIENLVELTAKEHFICHYLLTKVYEIGSRNWYKMQHAFMIMSASSNGKRYINSRLYNTCRINFSKVMSNIQNGINNSQYGTKWITNISLEKNQKIKDTELSHWLAIGWTEGRIFNFEKFKVKSIKSQQTLFKKEIKLLNEINLLRKYHKIYSKVGFIEFVNLTGFKNSQQNLVQRFKKHLPEFVPQQGKKRH